MAELLADAALLIGVAAALAGVALAFGLPAAMILGGCGLAVLGGWLGLTKPTDRSRR